MRILCNIHLYPPVHNCGSEHMLHQINKFLISRGHEIRVVLQQANMHKVNVPYDYEGVKVFGPTKKMEQYDWADILVSHLDFSRLTMMIASKLHKPFIWLSHNDIPYATIYHSSAPTFVVYNSEWMSGKMNYPHPSMVMPPPSDYRVYDLGKDPSKNEFITLINLNANKGAEQFYKIAEALPERKFLAVKGSYDDQILSSLPNVTTLENTSDIMPIYEKTRILLVPSEYESYGKVATEAMCNGIPVVSTGTPGLRENCDLAGIYIGDRNDIKRWVSAIKMLDDEKNYKVYSDKSRARSRQLDPGGKFTEFENFIYEAREKTYLYKGKKRV